MGPVAAGVQDRLGAILAICRKMNSERDLASLLDVVAREATSLLECDRASIFLLDRERNELWSKVALGSPEILRFDARRGVVGSTVMSGLTANVCNAYDDSRFYHAIDGQTGYRTRNVLAVAMRNQRGEIIGAFEALNKNHGDFTSRDEESLEALASHAAISIETAQLIGELRRSQNELVEQNAHLFREVESRYAAHGIIASG
ncbi:MAG: GAF domain-containing protein, partial [Bryobacteraceae bacterium]